MASCIVPHSGGIAMHVFFMFQRAIANVEFHPACEWKMMPLIPGSAKGCDPVLNHSSQPRPLSLIPIVVFAHPKGNWAAIDTASGLAASGLWKSGAK
jgi:hypothetical protein